jgi:hypothetical protein
VINAIAVVRRSTAPPGNRRWKKNDASIGRHADLLQRIRICRTGTCKLQLKVINADLLAFLRTQASPEGTIDFHEWCRRIT